MSDCADAETVNEATPTPPPAESTSAPAIPTAGPAEQGIPAPEVGSPGAISVCGERHVADGAA
ncbi:hypothetical protein C5E05_08455 [Pseudoclavibacter sp. AY1H1]|nr:hypothetical protein C5E05_08455 [Pseudoclavibacter sp. AY1H1]